MRSCQGAGSWKRALDSAPDLRPGDRSRMLSSSHRWAHEPKCTHGKDHDCGKSLLHHNGTDKNVQHPGLLSEPGHEPVSVGGSQNEHEAEQHDFGEQHTAISVH